VKKLSSYETLRSYLKQNQKVWLITGVAGFIGSNLLQHLLKLNQIVIGIDNFSTGYNENLLAIQDAVSQEQNKNFTFYEGDICSMSDCEKVTTGVSYVLHQAALGSVPRSLKIPEETHFTNTNGFINILKASIKSQVKRFVYASSSAVYGDSTDLPKTEEKIGKPLSPYAVSKYTGELYAHVFSNCYGIETIGLRYFNVFGPHQDPNGPYAAVIPRWIKAVLQNTAVHMNGDGTTSRDFCYIENVVQANLLSATTENKNSVNTVYNVAIGEQNTLKKLYDLIVETIGATDYDQLIYNDFRSGDIRHSLANIDKAKSLLGYCPTHTLGDGLKTMLDWYRLSLTI
jgi:UDP-N-acetylglucosamine 4-epimerase